MSDRLNLAPRIRRGAATAAHQTERAVDEDGRWPHVRDGLVPVLAGPHPPPLLLESVEVSAD
ncbi:hypothetical protein ACFV0O_28775 [Kitasatospora sp. NPDC059577]|uniref:hypothetical protein n=1 Tax=Kitasatospora sp. NPDC059577 TaxID=3346873 RepID=UPI0036CCEB17